jgi:spermidine/putrescine transport system ATP-binding protein
MSPDSLLTVDNVSKHFGDIIAVDDVSFDINDGEFITILGPSGSGKSTILRMIAGFEQPTEGTLSIRGERINEVPPFERDVNMVFQHLALFPHLSVEENIEYGLKNQGIPKDERKERIDEMLDMVHLSGYNDRDPMELSGGEQQRVALARALVNRPEIVLFDEPLASLDRKLRQHMQVELQRIQSETGVTFLYVTHDQEVSLAVSDRLILLNQGEIEQIGTADDLYENPASRFVAEFIGDVNTIHGTANAVNSQVALESKDDVFEFPVEALQAYGIDDLGNGDGVDIGVRPQSFEFAHDSDADGPRIDGQVENRIYQGHYNTYRVDTKFGTLSLDSDVQSFDIGDEVVLTWDTDDTHFFPAETTEREGV